MAERRRTRATLRQVAERAGVSLGTASAVFSGNSAVSDEAQRAVRRAGVALGYEPRRANGPSGRAPTPAQSIGLVIRVMEHSLPTNPFYSAVLHGAQRVCASLGLSLSYELITGTEPRHPLPLLVQRREIHGLLLVGYLPDHTVDEIAASGIPCVLVDNSLPTGAARTAATLDCVRNDDETGGYLATRHLLDLGHTDPVPAMIAGPVAFPSIRDRLRGYQRAIVEAGYAVDPALIRDTTLSPAGGRSEMDDLLDLPRPPTGVFCCNDATALGVLATARERGVSVPDDLSVVGYDDIELAAHAAPPLTTVQVDKELMGAQAVWHLVQRIGRPALTARDTRLEVALVNRSSTGVRRRVPVGLPHARPTRSTSSKISASPTTGTTATAPNARTTTTTRTTPTTPAVPVASSTPDGSEREL